MTYTFHHCQTHPKCPDLTGWYLELSPDDPETLMKVHRGVAALYYFKVAENLHSDLYNPVLLAANWLRSVERFLLAGESILVNCNGGIMPMNGTIILVTVESDDIDWDVRFDDEIITISRWPAARHYYLFSSKHRIFVPDKYVTFDDAYAAALRYVPAKRLAVKC